MSFCRARLGAARRGVAGQGKGCFQRRAGNRSPVQIVAGRGSARHGVAGQGKAGQGLFSAASGQPLSSANSVNAGHGAAWRGRAGRGWAWLGKGCFQRKGFALSDANRKHGGLR